MLCERCGKNPASHKTTDIINHVKSVKRLCDACFAAEGLGLPFTKMNLEQTKPAISYHPTADIQIQIVHGGSLEERELEEALGPTCEICGLDLATFRKRGAIGCPHDFEVFAEEIRAVLLKLHGGREHRGKLPRAFQTQRARAHQVRQLETDLERAVAEERYEEAANLRDRIRALQRDTDIHPVEDATHNDG
ncbi:MAG TPA: hypothetical protein ENK43_14105 [Planctomycetes bacterium]|nr:hypothetical protein [Planctomycetota bacterium]